MSVIRFDHVSKSYPRYLHVRRGLKASLLSLSRTLQELKQKQFFALQDVSFEIAKGETVGVMGPNGSGKSTALALMAGVLGAETGCVSVQGRVCPLLELGAGFHYDLTGRENIVLNGILLGLTRREVMARLPDILEFSELDDFLDQPVRTYSSGMVARLGFSIAVHLDPEVLLIDEILAVGDLHFQTKCREKMKWFKNQKTTIVLVSHSTGDIRQLCDRVLWLDRGKLVGQGSPNEIVPLYETSQRTKA
ncbi:MAG: ABC transporter ATP-binding protein [Nitrospirota bacterium]|nr:ABC transporter ATP-binding protein [Nitrospirota bacterium]